MCMLLVEPGYDVCVCVVVGIGGAKAMIVLLLVEPRL